MTGAQNEPRARMVTFAIILCTALCAALWYASPNATSSARVRPPASKGAVRADMLNGEWEAVLNARGVEQAIGDTSAAHGLDEGEVRADLPDLRLFYSFREGHRVELTSVYAGEPPVVGVGTYQLQHLGDRTAITIAFETPGFAPERWAIRPGASDTIEFMFDGRTVHGALHRVDRAAAPETSAETAAQR